MRPFLLLLIKSSKVGENGNKVAMTTSETLFRQAQRLLQFSTPLFVVSVLDIDRAEIAEQDDDVRIVRRILLQQSPSALECRFCANLASRGIWGGWGASEAQEAFVTSLAGSHMLCA